jgi:hypothetical protein
MDFQLSDPLFHATEAHKGFLAVFLDVEVEDF